MWEARCEPGRVDDCVEWLAGVAEQARAAGATRVDRYRSADRVVLVTRWEGPVAWSEPEAPSGLVARAHAWAFDAVDPA